jgi:hypothetical protein
VELKKENKNEEYRELARGEIRSIDAAIPILKYEEFIFERKIFSIVFNRKEEEYKTHLKEADDAQQAATVKRKVQLNYFLNFLFFFCLEIRR